MGGVSRLPQSILMLQEDEFVRAKVRRTPLLHIGIEDCGVEPQGRASWGSGKAFENA